MKQRFWVRRLYLYTGRGWLASLEVENERLQGELDALRQRAVSTPQHELRAKNERLTAQLREVEKSDKTRAQLGLEISQLKQELDRLRRSNGKNASAALRRQVKVVFWAFVHEIHTCTYLACSCTDTSSGKLSAGVFCTSRKHRKSKQRCSLTVACRSSR